MSEFTCKACGWHGFPSFELVGNKMLARCMNDSCAQIDASVTPADFNRGVARLEGKDVVVATVDRAAAARPIATPRMPAVQSSSLVEQIRERVAFLEIEIARMRGYELESRQLKKMLTVAAREEARMRALMITVSPPTISEKN